MGNTRFIDVMSRVDGPGTAASGSDFPKVKGVKRSAEGCYVYVRGFDFGTTYEQLKAHMSSLGGTIIDAELLDKGSAVLTYSSADEAAAAIQHLSQTTIPGNTRFIDVMSRTEGPGSTKRQ